MNQHQSSTTTTNTTATTIRDQHSHVKLALERIFKSHVECKVNHIYRANVLALASEGFCSIDYRDGDTYAIRK